MSIGAIGKDKDTFILYVDAHNDGRGYPNSSISHSEVYPYYEVQGLRIVRIRNLYSRDSQPVITPPFGRALVGFSELEQLIEEAKRYKVVQYHIDPDAFNKSNKLERYFSFGSIYRIHEAERSHVDDWEDPDFHFELIRKIKPDFVGIFEFQLYYYLPTSHLAEGIERLIEATVPDAKNIILPEMIIRKHPSLKDAFKPADLYSFKLSIDWKIDPKKYAALINGEEFDMQKLIRGSRTFGIFDSHAHALLTFNYR